MVPIFDVARMMGQVDELMISKTRPPTTSTRLFSSPRCSACAVALKKAVCSNINPTKARFAQIPLLAHLSVCKGERHVAAAFSFILQIKQSSSDLNSSEGPSDNGTHLQQ